MSGLIISLAVSVLLVCVCIVEVLSDVVCVCGDRMVMVLSVSAAITNDNHRGNNQ